MLSNKKYRINNMSKDLNLKSKDLVDLLAKHGFTGRTHMAVLEPMDFSVILNELTSEKQISSIDDYLNGVIKIERPVEKAPSEATKSKTPSGDKTDSIKDTVTVKTPEIAAQQQGQRPAQRQRPAQQQGQRPAQQQKQRQTVQQQGQILINGTLQTITKTVEQTTPSRSRSQQQFTRPQPVQPKQPKHQKQTQQYVPRSASDQPVPTVITQAETRTIGSARVVNTRSSNVDLARYDDKVEKLVPEAAKDVGVEKQKLKKQNTRDSAPKNRGTSRGRDSVSRGRDMKTAGRDASSRGRFDREKSAMERLKKQELEKARKAQLRVSIPDTILVSELASRLKVTASDVVKRLVSLGVMANVNQTIDYDTAYLVADELGAKVTREVVVTIEDKLFSEKETEEGNLVERAPVVVVMGHVDHGKTSLLDKIRNAHVTEGEAGGITQHIGAYRVKVKDKEITFLDTPGHAAFTAMRARGAKATDIAILVVAADDGIMPQTIEAINHAKEAELDIIVAINKMDKPNANPDTVMQGLTNYDLIPEAWGGDVICVPVSAITGFGIDDLLENILILAEMKEYKSNPERRARGIVIESKLDKGRGPVASLLIQNGTLNNGDVIIAGTAVGRVRSMSDERGNQVKSAGPSVPVEISGLDEIPAAGDEFNVVEDERMARELADQRRIKLKEEEFNTNSKVNLDDLFSAISEGVKELKIIVKADVDGSAEAVKSSLEKLSNDEVKVRIIHIGVGGITENDVMLASASNAIIVGFNVRPDKNAIDTAERQSVDIRTYRIIYECIEEIEAALKGMLAPMYKENILGHVEVRQTIHVPNVGTIAGSYVQDGKVVRSAQIRVLRDSVVIFVDKISSLRRFKDDVREVAQGYECGIGLERFNDIKTGDILEAFEMVEIKR